MLHLLIEFAITQIDGKSDLFYSKDTTKVAGSEKIVQVTLEEVIKGARLAVEDIAAICSDLKPGGYLVMRHAGTTHQAPNWLSCVVGEVPVPLLNRVSSAAQEHADHLHREAMIGIDIHLSTHSSALGYGMRAGALRKGAIIISFSGLSKSIDDPADEAVALLIVQRTNSSFSEADALKAGQVSGSAELLKAVFAQKR